MKDFIITIIFLLSLLMLTVPVVSGQTTSATVPVTVKPSQKYLFYLHGGVVQQQGANAVSQYYGAYEYTAILDSLASYGYHVISEVRPKDTDEITYAGKVAMQIDTLFQRGVRPEQVVVVGASQGAYIALEAAHIIKNRNIKYVVLGLCSNYALDYFSDYGKNLKGNFLSIYESSDSKGSCNYIFKDQPAVSMYREIRLNMGIDHAFLFKPYREWVLPLVQWIDGTD